MLIKILLNVCNFWCVVEKILIVVCVRIKAFWVCLGALTVFWVICVLSYVSGVIVRKGVCRCALFCAIAQDRIFAPYLVF